MRLDLIKFETLQAANIWAIDEIDTAAGAARARYLTIAPGQEITYYVKYQQALSYISAGRPEDTSGYPWLVQAGVSPSDNATIIKAVGDVWYLTLGPLIEGLRMAGKTALPDIETITGVVSHTRSVVAALSAV